MSQFAALTHPGARAGENQDAVGWDLEHQLWFVADGMGGYSHGQEASRLVKETLLRQIATTSLNDAVLEAHEAIRRAAALNEGDQRMGSTVVCAQIAGRLCHIVWVGDSRAYLWRSHALQRLTRDHSFIEMLRETESLTETELRNHPNAHVVLQTLGMGTPAPSDRRVRLRHGDWILLCSDGLPVELRDMEIAAILESSASPDQAAQQLLDGALGRGGRDNTSVIVIQPKGAPGHGLLSQLRALARPGGWRLNGSRLSNLDGAIVGWIGALFGVLLAAAVGIVAWYLRSRR
jgi:PPM family protein phosphatase